MVDIMDSLVEDFIWDEELKIWVQIASAATSRSSITIDFHVNFKRDDVPNGDFLCQNFQRGGEVGNEGTFTLLDVVM